MRKMKKIVAVGLSAMMLAGTFVACGDKEDSTTTAKKDSADDQTTAETTTVDLTVWGPQEEQDFLKTQCEAFDEAHPEWDINFTYGVCSEADAKNTVTQDLDAAADVFYFANDHLSVLVSAGAVAEFAGTYKDQIASINDERFMDSVTYEGKVYGVPFTPNTWFMYYDKSVFTEEDVKSLETMLEKGKVAFPLKNSWCNPAFYLANGSLFGEEGIDASAGVTFGDEMGVATTKYLVELVKNPNFVVADIDMGPGPLSQGCSAVFSGSWDANNVKELLGDNMGVAIAPTVTINGVTSQLRPYGGSKCVGVNTKTAEKGNQVQATTLAVYLGSEEVQKARYEARQITPAMASIQTGSDITTVELQQIQNAFPQPKIKEMDSVWGPFGTMGEEIMTGVITDENAEEKTKKMAEDMVASGL